MKKVFLLFLTTYTFVSVHTQSSNLKYIIEAPDGSTAMTVSNLAGDTIELESKMDFYKYQLLDVRTSEPVISGNNRGKNCTVDISEIVPGTYNLRFYTKSFIVTAKIEVRSLSNNQVAVYTLAAND